MRKQSRNSFVFGNYQAPYEQTDLKYQVSVIKQLNEEEPCDVYLCEYFTKVIQGKPTKVGKPIYIVCNWNFLLSWSL